MTFDFMLHGKIGSDTTGFGKGRGLDQSDNNLLPYDPCKDAWEFAYGVFIEKGEKNYQS